MREASRPIIRSRIWVTGRSMRRLLRVFKRLPSGELWSPRTPIGCPPACADAFSYACSGVSLDRRTHVRLLSTAARYPQLGAGRRIFVIPTAYLDARGEQELFG